MFFILRLTIFGEDVINYLDGDLKSEDYSLIKGAGIHLIDLINWMIKLRPLTVSAYGNKINTKQIKI